MANPLIQFRVSPEEYEKIQKQAEKDQRSISGWTKLLFINELNKLRVIK